MKSSLASEHDFGITRVSVFWLNSCIVTSKLIIDSDAR